MKNEKEMTLSKQLIWALGQSSGRQFITGLIATYVLVFLTENFGIGVGTAGIIMTAAAVWDAINDPILGSIADRTKTRWGTYRPYLLFVPLPLAIVSVLLFAAPDLTPSGKVVYAAVLYICYGMLVTCIEIPYNAILPTVTKNSMERNDAISISTFIASIMLLVVTSFTPNLVAVLGGENPSKGYMILVGIAGTVMCVTTWFAFIALKEKYTVEKTREDQIPVIEKLKKLLKVREVYPILLFWCVGCILFQLIMSSSVYYCMYYLMNPGLITTYMLVISIGGMVGVMGLMPFILRAFKGSMKKAVTYTQLISIICYALCFFIGSKSIAAIYVLTFIGSMFATMTNAFRPMTVVGMTEYVYQITGEHLNGTISAIGGFAYKCGNALSNAILAGVLSLTGFIVGAIGEQPDSAMIGINSVRFLIPLAASVLYIIFIQFYPEKKMKQINANKENR